MKKATHIHTKLNTFAHTHTSGREWCGWVFYFFFVLLVSFGPTVSFNHAQAPLIYTFIPPLAMPKNTNSNFEHKSKWKTEDFPCVDVKFSCSHTTTCYYHPPISHQREANRRGPWAKEESKEEEKVYLERMKTRAKMYREHGKELRKRFSLLWPRCTRSHVNTM